MRRSETGPELDEVREATRRDLRAIARLHRRCLPDGFFARLGPGFLRRYHASFLASPLATALVVAGPDGDPSAFLVGTLRNRAHYRWVMQRHGVGLATRMLLALWVRPRLAWVFARTRVGRYVRWVLRYPFRHRRTAAASPGADAAEPAAAPVTAPQPVAVLTHVAVDEAARGNGAGRRLVEVFVDRAREAGAAEARLVTDVDGGASAFYERLGWSLVGERNGESVVREYRLPLQGRG
jgi:ribosomal protein S18 acetylase RimI-like enzyme